MGARKIARDMVVVADGRHVHYRVAGQGMPVVLLHQSPLSSADFLELIGELAGDYLVIAPDTPGNGLSDPLPLPDETARMSDYADALAMFLDALGLDRVALYGFHTGALCALEFALRHPGRVITAVANGYVDLPAGLRADLLAHYFAPVEPDWAGGHLHWWWMRLREQYHFFPWYRPAAANRTGYDMPGTAELHAAMMEVMRAGSAYRRPYMAAMAHDSLAALQGTEASVTVMVDKTDLLYPCLDAIVDPAPGVVIRRPENPRAAIAVLKEVLASQRAGAARPRKVSHPPAAAVRREFVEGEGGRLFVRGTDGPGRAILLVPDMLEGGGRWEPAMLAAAGTRPVIAIDPPGAGASAEWSGQGEMLAVQARAIAAELGRRGMARPDIVARERGVPLALAVAHALGGPCRLFLPPRTGGQAAPDMERLAPEIALDPLGGHLVRVWAMLRAQELYQPWYEEDAAHAIRGREPVLDPAIVHMRLVDFFDALPRYREIVRSNAQYPVQDRLADLRTSITEMPDVEDDARLVLRVAAFP